MTVVLSSDLYLGVTKNVFPYRTFTRYRKIQYFTRKSPFYYRKKFGRILVCAKNIKVATRQFQRTDKRSGRLGTRAYKSWRFPYYGAIGGNCIYVPIL